MKRSIFTLVFMIVVCCVHSRLCAQATCSCTEYIYLNDANNGVVHKFEVTPAGILPEVNSSGPWLNHPDFLSPHGLGTDLNGYLYIAENVSGDIRQVTCDGVVTPESQYVINQGGYNIFSVGNQLFVNPEGVDEIVSFNTCDGAPGDSFCFNYEWGTLATVGWGMAEGSDGFLYAASFNEIYRFTMADLGGPCNGPLVGFDYFANTIGMAGKSITGIDADENGNIYATVLDSWGGPSRVLKFDAAGLLVAQTSLDATEGDGGWYGATGIVYSETTGHIFTSNYTEIDDCMSRFDSDLNYLGPAFGASGVTGNLTVAKAMGINVECCPIPPVADVSTNMCATVGDNVNLVDALPCEFVCAGDWAVISNSAGTFNACDNTFTVSTLEEGACFAYAYDPGVNASAVCAAFDFEVCIQFTCAPPPVCSIAAANGTPNNIDCNNGGTTGDGSDDTFTFDVFVTGTDNAASWTANDPNGTTGAYDVIVTMGPYPVSGGDVSFTITDDGDSGCTTDIDVTAPSVGECDANNSNCQVPNCLTATVTQN